MYEYFSIILSISCFFFCLLKNFRFVIALSICVTLCDSYKILLTAPFNGKSHFMFMEKFVRALLDRGHEVTFLTSNSLNHLQLENYTEVLVDPPLDLDLLSELKRSLTWISINIFKNFQFSTTRCDQQQGHFNIYNYKFGEFLSKTDQQIHI